MTTRRFDIRVPRKLKPSQLHVIASTAKQSPDTNRALHLCSEIAAAQTTRFAMTHIIRQRGAEQWKQPPPYLKACIIP